MCVACEWQGDHDLWPAAGEFCVCAGAQEQPANNWQSVGQRVGLTYLSRPRLSTGRAMSQLDNDGELPQTVTSLNWVCQSGTN